MPNLGRVLILAGLLLGRLGFAAAGASVPAYIVDLGTQRPAPKLGHRHDAGARWLSLAGNAQRPRAL